MNKYTKIIQDKVNQINFSTGDIKSRLDNFFSKVKYSNPKSKELVEDIINILEKNKLIGKYEDGIGHIRWSYSASKSTEDEAYIAFTHSIDPHFIFNQLVVKAYPDAESTIIYVSVEDDYQKLQNLHKLITEDFINSSKKLVDSYEDLKERYNSIIK